MRIILLTQWYPPEPQEFLSELAESLVDLGHQVTVLTGIPNWPSGEVYPGYHLRSPQREVRGGVPLIRLPLYPDHSRSGMRRALNFLSFATTASVCGPFLAPKADLVHVIHPPLTNGIPAWLLTRLRGIPFTYEIQDMWPETLAATGMLNNARALALVGHLAKWVYRRAAAIRVISPGFKANLIAKGVPAEKVHIISNWADTDFYRPVEPDPTLAERFGLADKFNVMFAGVIGLAQGLDTVLDAALRLVDLPDVQFVLVGDGVDLPRLQGLAQERGITNVRFLGRHPSTAMPGLYALSDVLLVHLRDDPLFRITIPHKTFAYLATGKPILAAVAGDLANVVIEAGAGLACPPSDPEALAATVRRFHDMGRDERASFGQAGRTAALGRYSRGYLAQQINAMLEGAVKRR